MFSYEVHKVRISKRKLVICLDPDEDACVCLACLISPRVKYFYIVGGFFCTPEDFP